jgi:pyridoxamine--pyruvate transaminase
MLPLDLTTPAFNLGTVTVEPYPAIRRALARPLYDPEAPEFQAYYAGIVAKLQQAFRASVAPVILQGEVVLALEAAAASAIGPEDVVLNLASGYYGKGYGYWAARYAREVVEVAVPDNAAIAPEAVAEALRRRPDVSVIAVTHHETPSGTINPVAAIGAIAARHGAIMIVDAASSFGAMDIHPEACGADIFVAAPSKCLGGAPGLSLVHVSDAAWARIDANPRAPFASMLSLKDWRDAHLPTRGLPFTPSLPEVNALDATLDLYLAEGPERVWARHAATARATRAGVRAMGLSLWAAEEAIAAPSLTAVRLPEGVDGAAVLAEARRRHGVAMLGGKGTTAGRLLRIAHMGPTARPALALVAVAALGHAMRAAGQAVDVAAGLLATDRAIAEDTDIPPHQDGR